MCLAVDHSSDQCLFISKSDPLKGMCGSPSLPCCLCHDEALLPVGAGGDNFPSTPLLLQLFSQGAFGYVLPIISFILAWIETWFLDFKVLPQEAEEENRLLLVQDASERAVLIPAGLSDGQFYSPPESEAGSEEEAEEKQDSEKPLLEL